MTESEERQAEELIKTMINKINANAERIKGGGEAFQIVFRDISVGYWIKVSMGGSVERVEKAIKKKESIATITTTISTLQGILDGAISPVSAMLSGQIQIEGTIETLMKLSAVFM